MKIDKGSPIEYDKGGLYKRLEKLNNIFPIKYNTGVDFGAGKGAYSLSLSDKIKSLIAFDVNKENLTEIRNHPRGNNIKLVITSGSTTCFKDNSFESLFAIEVLEHLEDMDAGIREIKRILTRKGTAYITVPNKYFPLETHHVYLFNRMVDGRFIPFLSMFDFIHNKIGSARRFSIKSLSSYFEKEGFVLLGYDYLMPPFDNFKSGRVIIKPITEILEKSFLKFLSSNLVAVFRKV
ncbi:MAG: methyltransferase domain-containing protein [Ignavibacteriaceae bacterium]|nr:methyltransferase domain-containing protein [Ignavibacteriaceae bacterium]